MKTNNTFNKQVMFFLMIILLISIFSLNTTALEIDTYDFANLTESEAITFIERHNINIPEEFSQLEDFPDFTRRLILQAYNYPSEAFYFNYDVTQEYAEEIRTAVLSYMNLEAVPATVAATTYSLLYNKVMDESGNWVTSGGYYNEKWSNYNCYAFAINRIEQPSFYNTGKQYQPGDMSGAGRFSSCDTIYELANIVKEDLEAMGYSNVSITSYIPTADVSQELICVRSLSNYDYHFMRYDIDTDSWYHKPGYTSVLKYNEIPSNSSLWYSEYSDANGEHPSTFTYNSDIVFIRYDKKQINVNDSSILRECIQVEKDVICELNFENSSNCEFYLASTNPIRYDIYNEEFDVTYSGYGTNNLFTINVNAGKYYLRMNVGVYISYPQYVDISIHMHSYTYHVEQDTATYHKAYCECGDYITQTHNYSYTDITDTHHTYACACGAVSTTHEEHVASRCVSNGSYLHSIYCKCGYLISEDLHEMLIISLQYSQCMHCGYIRDSSRPGQVIMGVEDKVETSKR